MSIFSKAELVSGDNCTIFALTKNGKCKFLEELQKLDKTNKDSVRKLWASFQKFADSGINNPSKFKKLKGFEIYEFRADQIRVFCFKDDDKFLICTHSFKKKTNKTPLKEIAKADELRSQYLND